MSSVALNTENISMIDIRFKNLSYEIRMGYRKPKKQILKNLNGIFKAGELTAIMGPSGAGKSTLLNVLNGFSEGRLTGTIEYINCNNKQKLQNYTKQSCYIQQMDYLHGLLTVQESMMIATQLKISNSNVKETQIDNILNTLNLMTIKNTPVERLSGGQKKRLNIALELIDNLPMMFLDEPTSGLDSMSSLQCISALQSLTKNGRTIICSIHQPSAALYQLFDYIYLIVNGQCMYAGTPDNTVNYFAQQGFQCPKYHNPADYILEVVNQEYGIYDEQRMIIAAGHYCQRDEVKERPIKSSYNENIKTITQLRSSPPSEMMKCWILIRRCATLLHRDWMALHLKMIIHFFTAIIIGLLFEKAGERAEKIFSNISFFEVCIIYISYTTMMPAVLKFPMEVCILRKEYFNNWYQLRTYYIAVLMTSIPLHIVITLIYSSTAYFLSSQPLELNRFFMFFLIMILTNFIAESIGLSLGTVCNPVNGTFVGAVTTATMITLNGFFCFFSHMSRVLYYISYLNYMRYSFDGLMQAVYGFQRERLICTELYCHYQLPSLIMKEMSLIKPTFWFDVIVLFSWFIISRIIAYVILKRNLSKL